MMEPLRGSNFKTQPLCYYWWNRSAVHFTLNPESIIKAGGVSSIIETNDNQYDKRRRRFIKILNKMKFETILENSIQNHILNFLTFAILLVIFKAQLRDED